eukprot:TRINITY_DN22554_c0_g1_i1.p1 TRINITY_DN22554_c0_g1~~TRINITY_DN22554_c0_g1_i1.p1  ORF type:complete len:611 (+),score=169.46 TRINITY_DN22554_c0_g1_i1:187-1833(+)
MQDLLAELDQTRREYAKLSMQLTQQDALIQHLKDAEGKKDQVITFLQEELQRVNQMNGQEAEVVGEEAKTKVMELDHRNKYLELEIARLTEENKLFSSFEKENRNLRESLLQYEAVVEKLQGSNDDLKSRSNTEMVDFRAQLESEFKRRLSDAEKKFRAEAYRALSEEAKIALQGNDHLQMVLQRQNDSIEGVLARCKQLETSHDRMRTEQDLAQQNLKQHQYEVHKLRKQLKESKEKNSQLEDALKQRRIERASLELLYMEYEATRKELAKTNASKRRAQKESERWKNRALQATTDMGNADQFIVTENAVKRQERVDEQLRKERQRRDRRQRLRERRAENASKLENAEGGGITTDPTSSDAMSDHSLADDDHLNGGHNATANNRVSPMEALAMWNINFEAWQNESGPPPRPDDPTSTDNQIRYDGDIDTEGDGDAAYHPEPPAAASKDVVSSKPRPAKEKVKNSPDTTQARLTADRNLSVLSRRRVQAVPPHVLRNKGVHAQTSRTGAPAPDFLTVVSSEGKFVQRKKSFSTSQQGPGKGANRFFVP